MTQNLCLFAQERGHGGYTNRKEQAFINGSFDTRFRLQVVTSLPVLAFWAAPGWQPLARDPGRT